MNIIRGQQLASRSTIDFKGLLNTVFTLVSSTESNFFPVQNEIFVKTESWCVGMPQVSKLKIKAYYQFTLLCACLWIEIRFSLNSNTCIKENLISIYKYAHTVTICIKHKL